MTGGNRDGHAEDVCPLPMSLPVSCLREGSGRQHGRHTQAGVEGSFILHRVGPPAPSFGPRERDATVLSAGRHATNLCS